MAGDQSVRAYLESLGLRAMPPASALAALGRVLRVRTHEIGIMDVAWPTLGRAGFSGQNN